MEFLMSEWHVTPDYIVNNWTDELFDLMVEKLVERRERTSDTASKTQSPQDHSVSPETLAAMSRGMIKVEKKHGD
ncbi:unnamed protein product [marine sediment metagenome]|uniref:Uncharacterized protein n=1 Tax=marine sediment metagenome TaxID=412755 RepID=X1C638_9ZZZZ